MAEDILKIEGLPARTPRYRWRGKAQCRRTIKLHESHGQGSGYFVFDGVDHRAFLRWLPILTRSRGGGLASLVDAWQLRQASRLIYSIGSEATSGGRTKRSDGDWQPSPVPIPAQWPSVVLEIGLSEGPGKLKKDAQFWLTESHGQTRSVITVNITKKLGRITLENWTMQGESIGSAQKIHINESYKITGPTTFTIPFESFFLRDKGSGESDFEITHEELRRFAQSVRRSIRATQST
ncbi:hypothetical protein N7466_010921 [Penicillium verhagenii]|uniref:uncharacterized protein n=1 Tax=Penicillium verhagenii TaxID=1562060 RepID=UPI0025453687|nr:uncharacterized protein N7466_010921 [Penicillium verhagenii]KAJ5917367.1 hypothetical protein N7466_010921 [Penicillium verhagenii]